MKPRTRLHRLFRSWSSPAVAGLACLGATLCFLFYNEPAVGTVRGRVVMAESGKPLGGALVSINVSSDSSYGGRFHSRRAIAAADGTFAINRVPAGDYEVTAAAAAHSTAENTTVWAHVEEGRVTPVTVNAERSLPVFALHQGHVIFGTHENARLGFTGYLDVKKDNGTDTLHLTVWKTKLSTLLNGPDAESSLGSVGRDYDHVKSIPKALLKPASGPSPVQVINSDVRITEADREGFFHKRYAFTSLAPGLYLVDVAHAGETDCTWLMVTNTALVEKRAGSQVVAYVVDMLTGAPVAGSEVRTYRNGNVIAHALTSASGLVDVELPVTKHIKKHAVADAGDDSGDIGDAPEPDPDKTHITTVALRGEDEAVVNKDYYRNENAGDYAVHSFTDRPIYRPGQHISFKDIVREIDPNVPAGPGRYRVPAGSAVHVELRDPNGEKLLAKDGKISPDGCYWGQADLDAEAPTGVYSLITTIGGEAHTHDITIASYRKPQYTVTVTPDKDRYVRGDTVTMTISASYYFGAPVVGSKVDYNVLRQPAYSVDTSADDTSGDESDAEEADSAPAESFGGTQDSFYGEDVTHGSAVLDENGKAVVTFRADSPQDPEGPQQDKYTLSATVTEGEDNEVTADGEANVRTGDFDLSVSPEGELASPGQPDSLIITARDADGHPVPNLAVEIESGYHRWSEGKYAYQEAAKGRATLGPDGKTMYALTPARAGEVMIKVRAWDAHGHKIVAQSYIWVAPDGAGDMDTEYADLSLHTDKRRYNPGETARVLVNSIRTGETILLTIEGERVFHTQLVHMDNRSEVVRVPILAEYGPNVYLDACYVRDKKFATCEAPLRVSLPKARLNVSIAADRAGANSEDDSKPLAKYAPGDKISYTIRTTDDEDHPVAAELAFGVVDEAIYALKDDSPGALHDTFYPHRSNLVQTEYSFSIAFMGDADKSEPQIVARTKFPDTAYWNPDIRTDSRGEAHVSFTLPDNLTTWRATATAATAETRIGRTTQKVMVAKDFLVRMEAPRFLTQHDKSRLVTIVHNDTGTAQDIIVKLEPNNLQLDGKPTQSVHVNSGAQSEMVWPVTALEPGDAGATVKAWTTAPAPAKQFTDGEESHFPVTAHGREVLTAAAGSVSSGKPASETLRITPDSVAGSARLTVRITPSIATALLGGTEYLIGYPYGCTEQTMSRIMPDLMVARTLKRTGGSLGQIAHADQIPKMVRNGLLRLARFQHADSGAWGWWEHDTDSPWMTAYVLYGLAEAKADGYSVNPQMLQRGRQAAVKMLADPKLQADTRVFLMYGLAVAGNMDEPRKQLQMLRLNDLDDESIAYMVLLEKALGIADSLPAAELEKRSIFGDSMIHWNRYANYWDWDATGVTAVALRAITAVDPNDPRIDSILRWLMYHRTGSYWGNTRDTSFTLMALCDYLAAHRSSKSGGSVSVTINHKPFQTFALTGENMKEKELVLHVPASELRSGDNLVTFENTGGSTPVFYSVELKQMVGAEDIKAISPVLPATAHLGSEPKHTGAKGGDPANQLVISRVYQRVISKRTGMSDWGLVTEDTDNQLNEGDRVRVKLTINAPRDMSYVLIEDPFPAGCEVTERGEADEVVEWGFWYSSVDIRDSKIAFFARTLPKGTSVIEYNLRAKTHGSYHAMPTLLQAMYSPDMHAESAEDRVMIR